MAHFFRSECSDVAKKIRPTDWLVFSLQLLFPVSKQYSSQSRIHILFHFMARQRRYRRSQRWAFGRYSSVAHWFYLAGFEPAAHIICWQAVVTECLTFLLAVRALGLFFAPLALPCRI
jgi:hypothetical protein